ncbi:Uncharacterized protein Fot_24498 [Forsythia ovata]|uniref:Uncharacterized protein n=1 Tax=Forsythia ovata TaxID=205694 RepID=A0ABD1U6D0_9LAMI
MDIDDKHFNDPDSDDEANNHLSGMERSHLSNRHFGQARSLQLKVIRGRRVVDERWIPPLKLLIPSTASILVSTVPSVVEVVGNVSSSFQVLGTVSIPVAIVPPVVGVIGSESSFVSFVVSVEPLEGVEHQVKEKRVDKWEKVAPKRALVDEGDVASSANVKRGRMDPPQETAGSILTLPSMVQILILYFSDWTERINNGSRQDECGPVKTDEDGRDEHRSESCS